MTCRIWGSWLVYKLLRSVTDGRWSMIAISHGILRGYQPTIGRWVTERLEPVIQNRSTWLSIPPFFFMDHTKFLGTEVLNKGCKLWTMNGICMFRPQRPWNYLSIEQFFPTCRMPPPSRAPLSPSWDKLNHPSQIYTPFRVSLMLVYTTGSCWSRGWNAERWTWVRTIAFKLKETKKARELILSLTLSWFYALNFPRLSLTM